MTTQDPANPYGLNPLAEHEQPLTWAKTRQYMRVDFQRNIENFGGRGTLFTRLIWRIMPNVLAIQLYRISRYFYVNGWFKLSLIVSVLNQYITRTEIPPTSSIGPGCLIGHAEGVTLYGRIGANFTAHGFAGIGGGYGRDDVGGGPGFPILGDNVSMAHFSMAQGPVRVGNNARFGPYSHVTKDVPDDAVVIAPPCRIQRRTLSAADPAADPGADPGAQPAAAPSASPAPSEPAAAPPPATAGSTLADPQ